MLYVVTESSRFDLLRRKNSLKNRVNLIYTLIESSMFACCEGIKKSN